MLQTLKGELVEVVVDADHPYLGPCIVLQQFEHLLGVDQTAQVEDQVLHRNLHLAQVLREGVLDVAFQELGEVARLELLSPHDVQLIEVLRVVLPEVADKVLINDLVANAGRLQLGQLELDCVQIQYALRRFLHRH